MTHDEWPTRDHARLRVVLIVLGMLAVVVGYYVVYDRYETARDCDGRNGSGANYLAMMAGDCKAMINHVHLQHEWLTRYRVRVQALTGQFDSELPTWAADEARFTELSKGMEDDPERAAAREVARRAGPSGGTVGKDQP
jgi:hypothetical protein